VEQRLLKAIMEFVQHAFQYQQEMQRLCPPGVAHPFTLQLLHNLRECVRSCLVPHISNPEVDDAKPAATTQAEPSSGERKNQLRTALLSNRHRAELMHVVVQLGHSVKEHVDEQRGNDWSKMSEAFLSMLDK